MPSLTRPPTARMMTLVALAAVIELAAPTSNTAGQSPTPTEVATEAAGIFRTTMSPFCPGMTLETCPSPQAAVLRDSIRAWLTSGHDREQITSSLYDVYGDQILAAPPFEGVGIVGWLLPGTLITVLAVVMAIRLVRIGATAPPVQADSPGEALDAAEEEKLRHALAELRD